jgi:uncharacterized membrane protein YhaH (DUF805 family)
MVLRDDNEPHLRGWDAESVILRMLRTGLLHNLTIGGARSFSDGGVMSLSHLFTFSGRLGRREYWLWQIGWLLVVLVSFFFAAWTIGGVISFIVIIAALLSRVSIEVRRWHDLDMSGGWFFISLVPILGLLFKLVMLGFVAGSLYQNRYGAPNGIQMVAYGTQDVRLIQENAKSTPGWMLTASSSPERMLRTCPTCGKDNPLDDRFCGRCGQRLEIPALERQWA